MDKEIIGTQATTTAINTERELFKNELISLILDLRDKEQQALEALKEIHKNKLCSLPPEANSAIFKTIKEGTMRELKIGVEELANKYFWNK